MDSLGTLARLLFSFNGRIRRRDYWLAGVGAYFGAGFLFFCLLMVVTVWAMIQCRCGYTIGTAGQEAKIVPPMLTLSLYLPFWATLIWINLALQIKRWHDRDKPWPWVFLGLVPILGWIWEHVECGFLDGTAGPNRFGPSPKGLAEPSTTAMWVG